MLIPPRCYTCGEVLADKWIPYITAVQNDKNKSKENINSDNELLELKFIDVKNKNPEKSIEGKILDELNLHKYCCRRMMLGNVHIISYLS
jgi:DNA-directed RNA polymerase subunit N (RpoN/RPB10)|tara:strand:- start:2355 stop:2624 length:270 start_codon:yes stop_codon:yes gene_type:complete